MMKKYFLSVFLLLILVVLGAFLWRGKAAGPTKRSYSHLLAEAGSYDLLLAEGTRCIKQNKYEEARDLLQKAVAMNEDDYRAYYQLGLNAFAQITGVGDEKINKARCEEAVQYFDAATEKKSSYPNSYALRGMAFELLGNEEKALEDFSRYLELIDENDNSTLTKQVTARYQRLAETR